MKKALLASAACAALGLAASAQAAYTLDATLISANPTGTVDGDPVTLTGYSSYLLTLHSNNGALISAYDFANSGWGIRAKSGGTGNMLQAYTGGGTNNNFFDNVNPASAGRTSAAPTPPGLTPSQYTIPGNAPLNMDSAMLNYQHYWTSGPTSAKVFQDFSVSVLNGGDDSSGVPGDTPFAGASSGDFWNKSTVIHGAAGIAGPVQVADLPVAFVIVPTGSLTLDGLTSQFEFSVGVADSNNPSTKVEASGPITLAGVPEPTTASLLGLGALGLIARRRRA
jgi:hypothetical protein